MTFVLEPKSQALNPKPQTPIPYEPVNPNLKSLVILIVSLRGAFVGTLIGALNLD